MWIKIRIKDSPGLQDAKRKPTGLISLGGLPRGESSHLLAFLFKVPENQKQILAFPNQAPQEKGYRNPISMEATEQLAFEAPQPFLGDMYERHVKIIRFQRNPGTRALGAGGQMKNSLISLKSEVKL